jgi:hypothetical protein
MARTDKGAMLDQSRRIVQRAEQNVRDLTGGIASLRKRIEQVEREQEVAAIRRAESVAADLLRQRTAAFERLQAQLDVVAETFGEVLRLNDTAYSALPTRPNFRPLHATAGGITSMVELYICGQTEGRLCRAGMSPHVAASRPDLVASARDMAEQLLPGAQRRTSEATA